MHARKHGRTRSPALGPVAIVLVVITIALAGTGRCADPAAETRATRRTGEGRIASAGNGPPMAAEAEAGAEPLELRSPGGAVALTFSVADGSPRYAVSFRGEPIVLPSAMGFRLRGAPDLAGPFTVESTARREIHERWTPVWGQFSEVRDHMNELAVTLRETAGERRRLEIVLRAADDGVAFRYRIPQAPGLETIEIADELTRFDFASANTAWWIPADWNSYERLHARTGLAAIVACNTPVTMRTPAGTHLSVHEAALTDYAGMTLRAVPEEPGSFEADLVPWPDGVRVRGGTPLVTPWRAILLADQAGGLAESTLILSLNEPCRIEDTSWIRPMKYVGIWWGLHIKKETWTYGPRHGATTKNAKRYIDFASRHGIPGLLIEGWNTGWERWGQEGAYSFTESYPDFDLEAVVRYAREKGVVIIGHHETGGDVPGYERQIDDALDLYARLGVPAVKTGYAGGIFPRGQHHHGQWMVRHYRSVVEKAAERRIVIDAHEPIKPTGISRTWPNMMTREGARGMEYDAWSDGNPPEHTAILPFTRLLGGPMDYTPGIFALDERYQGRFRVRSTIAKQLALYVVIFSPLQMAADLPENYEGHPAFRFIEEVPVTWDETRVLDAEVGDFVITARRSGRSWFIGGLTDEQARVFLVPLEFLEEGTAYTARIYADAPDADWDVNPTAYTIEERTVDASTVLTMRFAPGGGQAVSIEPAEK